VAVTRDNYTTAYKAMSYIHLEVTRLYLRTVQF